ncbi:MAG TPA: hypothetical protein VN813_11750 [Luteibacter sp.]|nr:hypothetical protein [Luteibacter sp.]
MSDDLLHAGFTSASTRAPSTTLEFYMYGEHRSLRVTYPAGLTGTSRQHWAFLHHTTDEDRRCVGDILVTETG